MSVQGGGGGESADLGVLPADLPSRYVPANRTAAKRRWADKGVKAGEIVCSGAQFCSCLVSAACNVSEVIPGPIDVVRDGRPDAKVEVCIVLIRLILRLDAACDAARLETPLAVATEQTNAVNRRPDEYGEVYAGSHAHAVTFRTGKGARDAVVGAAYSHTARHCAVGEMGYVLRCGSRRRIIDVGIGVQIGCRQRSRHLHPVHLPEGATAGRLDVGVEVDGFVDQCVSRAGMAGKAGAAPAAGDTGCRRARGQVPHGPECEVLSTRPRDGGCRCRCHHGCGQLRAKRASTGPEFRLFGLGQLLL